MTMRFLKTNTLSISVLVFAGVLLQGNATVWAQSKTTPKFQHVATGRDPFDRVQTSSTHDFVWHLKNSTALRSRYAKHFGVPESQVVHFIQNSLIPYTIPSPRKMTTFGVAKNGQIYPVRVNLAKGTKVWATREGVPVFKWTCSNPLVYKLPGQDLIPAEYARVPRHSKPVLTKPFSISYPEELVAEERSVIARNSPSEDVLSELAVREPAIGSAIVAAAEQSDSSETTFVAPAAAPMLVASEVTHPNRPKNSGVEILLPLILGSGSALLPAQGTGIANASGGGGRFSGESVPVQPATSIPETDSAILLSLGALLGSSAWLKTRKQKS